MTYVRSGSRVAVIGAGPAGALCARALTDRGVDVTVFDKGRRPSARMATREYPEAHFDYGAQFITAREPGVVRWVDDWIATGVLARWDGPFAELSRDGDVVRDVGEPRYVGAPGMGSLVAHLIAGLDVRFGVRATRVRPVGRELALELYGAPDEVFDRVVVAVPAPQAVPLVEDWPALAEPMADVRVAPCWAVMMQLNRQLLLPWGGARVCDPRIAWIARNQTKPLRPPGEAWVIHATASWSRDQLEADPDDVAVELATAACDIAGVEAEPAWLQAHRWRYALVEQPVGEPYLFERGVGICGDALLGPRVEHALSSGAALADRILTRDGVNLSTSVL